MIQEEIIEIFGKISAQLVIAMSMHAENMQRQILGQSVAYDEEKFMNVIDSINSLLKKNRRRGVMLNFFKKWWKYYLGFGMGFLLGLWTGFIL